MIRRHGIAHDQAASGPLPGGIEALGRQHGADAPVVERAIAVCHLIDLAMALGEPADPWLADLRE